MSETAQNLTEDEQTATINDVVHKIDRKLESIAEKSLDFTTNFQQIMNDDRLITISNNHSEVLTDIKDNISLINADFNGPIKSELSVTGACKHDNNEIQPIWPTSGNDDSQPVEDNNDNCADECICKIKEAVGLIVEKIKKVDAVINGLAAKSKCPYTLKPEDKKEFAKSVEKNSTVCHIIIEELKKQRKEINEMLELYEKTTQEFLILEDSLKSQREKVDHIETTIESISNIVNNVKADVTKRHENFLLGAESRRKRVETREEILNTFLNWIMSLEAKRSEDRKAADAMLEEAIEERKRDRAMLTLVIGQLQEVKNIEILLKTREVKTTQEKTEAPADTMRAHLSTCACPMNVSAIIPGQCDNARGNCASNINPDLYFNINSNPCPANVIRVRATNALPSEIENGNGKSSSPIRYYKTIHVPINYNHRVSRSRRNSPTNCFTHQRRNTRNLNLDNSATSQFD